MVSPANNMLLIIIYYIQLGLATNGRTRHTPFKALGDHLSSFVSPECRPANIDLKNPCNMHKEDIQAFFKHVTAQQELYGPELAF